MKDYLTVEKQRNIDGKHVLTDYVRRAVKEPACDVLCLHHVTVTRSCDENGNEIPSADTVLFDHDFAKTVFGERYLDCLTKLAVTPSLARETVLGQLLEEQDSINRCPKGQCRSSHITEVA